jgi:DNA/RNA endonuclease YhcR with UshA esterase domain
LSLRNTGATGIVLDSIAITSTVPPVAEEVSIYDIQFATDAPYISPYEGELIKTRGVVTGVFLFGSNEKRFFIQDGAGAWNGIYVYENGTDLVIGDSVEVTGSVSEFFELTEIVSVSEINIISSGNPLPAPVEVTTAEASMEEYEGVLVKVISAECTNDDAGFGQFELNDGSGARLIDDEMYSYAAVAGNHYSVTGVTFLSFGDVKIFPRMMSDIEVTGFASIQENKSSFLMYPNPTDDFVYISTTNEETEVYFYSVSGKLVYKTIGSSQVNVNDFAPGVYQVVLKSNDSQSIEKLIVR